VKEGDLVGVLVGVVVGVTVGVNKGVAVGVGGGVGVGLSPIPLNTISIKGLSESFVLTDRYAILSPGNFGRNDTVVSTLAPEGNAEGPVTQMNGAVDMKKSSAFCPVISIPGHSNARSSSPLFSMVILTGSAGP
jgi:hypothetical protein